MRKNYTIFRFWHSLGERASYSFLALMLLSLLSNAALAQVILSGTSYTETFDGIGTGLPTGWSNYTAASPTSLGGTATFSVGMANWNSTTGGFRNSASADIGSTATPTQQGATMDRALSVRQVGTSTTFPNSDPGAAFAVQLSNTVGLQNFQLSFKLQSLDAASARITTWSVQYGIGSAPTAFTTIVTQPIGGTVTGFSNNTVTANFSGALDNISQPVWIRIVALSASANTGNRPTTGLDDFMLTYLPGTTDLAPTVTSTNPASSVTNVASNANISLTFSEPVTASTSSFNVVGSVSGPHTFTLAGGPTTYTLNPDTDFADGETVTVTALATQIADQDGTLDNMAANYTYSFSIAPPVVVVKIHDIQGSGSAFNPSFGGSQSIEGIVTRKFAGSTKLNGFYVQEEDIDADADPLTSEGIFVFDPSGLFTGNEGDKVKVTGTVLEFTSTSSGVTSSLTELGSLVSVINEGASTLPTPTVVNLPVANVLDLEAYEGMLVTMGAASGNLAVTEYFQIGRFGQVTLSAGGGNNESSTDARLDQYTQFHAPNQSGYAAYLTDLAKRKIILDDGSGTQNLDPILFGRGGNPLSATNTLRGGDEIASITTVLDERFEGYRLQSTVGVSFSATNARPITPPSVGGTLKVASANVLNFFVDLDLNASGTDFRGANTAEEFTRQRTKIVKNLIGSGADVLGLMELQANSNPSTNAIQNLVNALNAEPGSSGTYTFVDTYSVTTGFRLATDAITVGIIYKTDKVTPVGGPASLTTSATFDLVGRRPLAQTFRQNSNNEVFTLVVNHFKSKGSKLPGAGADDDDKGDGQGLSNATRKRQAQDLAAWLATNPTGTTDPDYLVVGDLNAYAKEDPLTVLATAGYNNLLPATSYSYVFDGQIGSLDHALGSSSLATQVIGAEKWHINADEPSILDYNTEFKSAGQVTSLYNGDQFRSADHDPVLIGLNLVSAPDLIALLYARPTVQYGTSNFTVVVDVVEINSLPTSGTIVVKVTKDANAILTLSSGATTIGGRTVQNGVWNFDDLSDLNYYILTTSQAVVPSDRISFGLDGQFTSGSTTGILTRSSVIVGGSGGELRVNNNADADKVDYFQQ